MTDPSLVECAALLRDATNQYARAALRNRLARAVRGTCFQTLITCNVPESAAEDYTNDLAFDLVCRIERGQIARGCEEAYVKQAARNRARDHFRQQSGITSRFALDEDIEVLPAETDPERLLLALEEEEETRALAQHVRSWLEQAPPRYREYLVAVYLDGRAIEELVQAEVHRRLGGNTNDVAVAIAHQRARAAVDKVLERARTWVRRAAGGHR